MTIRRSLLPTALLPVCAFAQAPDYASKADTFDLPAAYPPTSERFLVASFNGDGAPDAFYVSDGKLVMIHSPALYPNAQVLTNGVSEFALLPGVDRSDLLVVGSLGLRRLRWNPSTLAAAVIATWPAPAWQAATNITSAIDPVIANRALVVGIAADGSSVLRASVVGTAWTSTATIVAESRVFHVCAADLSSSSAGLEVAYTTEAGLWIVNEAGTLLASPQNYPAFDGVVALASIRAGTDSDGTDSLAYAVQYGAQQLLYEIVLGQGASNAVFSGAETIDRIGLTPIGADALLDFVNYSQATQRITILRQRPMSDFPNAFALASEASPALGFLQIDVGNVAQCGWPLDEPSLVCADFDLDRRGDILLLDRRVEEDASRLIFLRGRDDLPLAADFSVLGKAPEGEEEDSACVGAFIDLALGVKLTLPAAWGGATAPTHVRLRVWLRPDLCHGVLPGTPFERFVEVDSGVPVGEFMPVSACVPLGSYSADTVLYIQTTWIREAAGLPTLVGPPSFWIAANTSAKPRIDWILCNEPDAETLGCPDQQQVNAPCGSLVGFDGPPRVRGATRRSRLGPWETFGSPGGN